jgi:small subunit ribosomal protein S16
LIIRRNSVRYKGWVNFKLGAACRGSRWKCLHYRPEITGFWGGILIPDTGSAAACRERRIVMSARIRLKKFGTKKRPYYRIVVMDQRAPRDGKTIEELGYYHPIEAEDRQIRIEEDRVKGWLKNGASVSDTVRKILNKKSISL